MQADAELVVLAAGMGSRYGGLKQLDPVVPGGEIVLDYSVFDALRAGFTRVVFVIRRDIEAAFRARIGARFEARIDVAYVFQELQDVPDGCVVPGERVKPWGTGHAVLAVRDAVTGPFAVVNADDFYGPASFRSLAGELQARRGPTDYAMVAFRLDRTLSEHGTVSRGVCTVDSDGRLEDVDERTAIGRKADRIVYTASDGTEHRLTGREPVSMNMWGFNPSVFGYLSAHFRAFLQHSRDDPKAEFFLPAVINALIQSGEIRVTVLHSEENWFGVTYREDKAEAMRNIRDRIDRGEYPERLWEG